MIPDENAKPAPTRKILGSIATNCSQERPRHTLATSAKKLLVTPGITMVEAIAIRLEAIAASNKKLQ